MIKKKNKPRERANADIYIEPIIFLSDNAPKELEEVVSELISMRGIIRLCICLEPKRVIYDYQRWGKREKTLEFKEIIELVKGIKTRLKKMTENSMEHLLIQMKEVTLLVLTQQKLLLFVQCERKTTKLPVAIVKAKQIMQALRNLN
ncbi:MAG: hypothetical protein ACTSWT_05485 [Candidatus Heimdallarchaeota archaeon]